MSRSIDDFVCISSKSPLKILENIALDMEFKKIDKQMKAFLNKLANERLYYFKDDPKNNEIT
ncbi:MAG: hypothetical protein U9Q66_04400 [Patescibacteria group bacterium]|nr:hypothetical protein [Patescibacteria group bacterium]